MTPSSKVIPLIQFTVRKETEKYFKNKIFDYQSPKSKIKRLSMFNENGDHINGNKIWDELNSQSVTVSPNKKDYKELLFNNHFKSNL